MAPAETRGLFHCGSRRDVRGVGRDSPASSARTPQRNGKSAAISVDNGESPTWLAVSEDAAPICKSWRRQCKQVSREWRSNRTCQAGQPALYGADGTGDVCHRPGGGRLTPGGTGQETSRPTSLPYRCLVESFRCSPRWAVSAPSPAMEHVNRPAAPPEETKRPATNAGLSDVRTWCPDQLGISPVMPST